VRPHTLLGAESATVFLEDSIVDEPAHALDDGGIISPRADRPDQVEMIARTLTAVRRQMRCTSRDGRLHAVADLLIIARSCLRNRNANAKAVSHHGT
jgi:hypothetical protein